MKGGDCSSGDASGGPSPSDPQTGHLNGTCRPLVWAKLCRAVPSCQPSNCARAPLHTRAPGPADSARSCAAPSKWDSRAQPGTAAEHSPPPPPDPRSGCAALAVRRWSFDFPVRPAQLSGSSDLPAGAQWRLFQTLRTACTRARATESRARSAARGVGPQAGAGPAGRWLAVGILKAQQLGLARGKKSRAICGELQMPLMISRYKYSI
jgi:hypothetical protein